jgi:hypothetical protein
LAQQARTAVRRDRRSIEDGAHLARTGERGSTCTAAMRPEPREDPERKRVGRSAPAGQMPRPGCAPVRGRNTQGDLARALLSFPAGGLPCR